MKTSTRSRRNVSIRTFLTLSVMAIMLTACSKDDDDPKEVDEEEVITTMNVTLTTTSGATVTLKSQDLDGDGPNAPVITVSSALTASTTYTGSIELLNETETPAEDVTEEVKEEADEHQFFFTTTGAIASTTYGDTDSAGNPIGVQFMLTTGDAGSATIQIILRHQPKKPNDGSLSDAGGSTDISQTFNVTVD